MSYAFSTVAASIAALSVSGVNIKTQATLQTEVKLRDLPALYPQSEFVVMQGTEIESVSTSPVMIVTYTLNYWLALAPVGSGRVTELVKTHQKAVTDKAALVFAAVAASCTALSGATWVIPASGGNATVVPDPSDYQFIGCPITFTVIEHINL